MADNQEGGTVVQQTTEYKSSVYANTGGLDALGMRTTNIAVAAQAEGISAEEFARLRAEQQNELAKHLHKTYVEAISKEMAESSAPRCVYIFMDGYDSTVLPNTISSKIEVANEYGVIRRTIAHREAGGSVAAGQVYQFETRGQGGQQRGSKEGAGGPGMGDRSLYVNQNFNPAQTVSARQQLSARGSVSQRGAPTRGGSSENVATARAHSKERVGSGEKTGSAEKTGKGGPGMGDRSLYVNQNFNPAQNVSARQQLSARGSVSQRGNPPARGGSSENVVTARGLSTEKTGSAGSGEKAGSAEKAKGPGQDRSLYVQKDFNPAQNP